MLRLARRFLDRLPVLNLIQKLPPSLPDGLIVASFPCLRNTEAPFVVIEDPQSNLFGLSTPT